MTKTHETTETPETPATARAVEQNGYLIDPEKRTITAFHSTEENALQKAVDGWISVARNITDPAGEEVAVLYVDDEGLLKDPEYFFAFGAPLAQNGQLLAGRGVLVGPERESEDGEFLGTEMPKLTIGQVQRVVYWVTREQAERWAQTAGPASSIIAIDSEGKLGDAEVTSDWSDLLPPRKQPG